MAESWLKMCETGCVRREMYKRPVLLRIAVELINKMNTLLKVWTCKHKEDPACVWYFSHADHKLICLRSASYSAIWFHFSAAVFTLEWILEQKMQWVPYETLPLN